MDIRNIMQGFAVAPQMRPSDMKTIADLGFVAVMCNRPDGEEKGQPSIAEMRTAAQSAGLIFHHIPVSGGVFPEEAIAAFRAVRCDSDGPVLAYCRTGTRSITLETLANPNGLTLSERLKQAAAAGYDLTEMSKKLAPDNIGE